MNNFHKFRIPHSRRGVGPMPPCGPEAAFHNQTIYPVILRVPEQVQKFKPKDRVLYLSRHARRALERSAVKSGIRAGELFKDENGMPLPFDGTFWSITHKTQYVGGVVAPTPIGIDIERIRDFSRGLFRKTAADREWALADTEGKSLLTFFRFWTSKEAVLKATGIGIKDLLKCQVRQILDDCHLIIHYEGKDWLIEHFFYDQHIASIVQSNFHIDWAIEK
ncbi:MAG: 4'-phosphopantetheinyl transferase superfamily protein [Desulfobacteraceae bacterium]|nr:4'-phosphopantetheinyl transferase superfamily protein [Desulfobacteraceae bacterium]